MGAETPNVRPGQEGPEGKLDPPVLGEWAQECPVMGDTVPGAQEQFLGGGGRGHTAFAVLPRGSTGQSLGPFYCSQHLHAGMSESRGPASPRSRLHEEPGQVSATQAGAAVSASQEAGWGRGSTAQACLQGQVLTEASVPPQFQFR